MMTLDEKFKALETDNASSQEVRQEIGDLNAIMRGEKFDGIPVDFSHGDVDAFPPTPGSSDAWEDGFMRGGQQAYTEYRGAARILEGLADRLGTFTDQTCFSSQRIDHNARNSRCAVPGSWYNSHVRDKNCCGRVIIQNTVPGICYAERLLTPINII
jgi:hypothetical protein